LKNQVVLWYGYPVRLEKRIARMFGNEYWDVTTLYTPEPEYMMIALKIQPSSP
jgi:hypothetical protein